MVTRNKSITVTGLHMLLQLAGKCYQTPNNQLNINFVEDTRALLKFIRQGQRVLWVDYGACLDTESFDKVFETQKNRDVLVFPAVTEGVDWNRFKKNIDSSEPVHQIGLNFDTTVQNKLSDGIWTVNKTVPKIFVMDGGAVDKKLSKKLPREMDLIFETLKESGVNVQAWTKANVLVHYIHECLGNILEANGVKVSA